MLIKTLLLMQYLSVLSIKYVCWPSKKNIVFLKDVPMFFLAVFGGIFFLMDEAIITYNIAYENIYSLAIVLSVGACFYVLFFYMGFKAKLTIKLFIKKIIHSVTSKYSKIYKFDYCFIILSLLTIALYVYSYLKMGFTPMFAENPMAAKFFASEYQESYRPVASFFRSALALSSILVSFLAILIFTASSKKMKVIYFLLFIAILLLTALSLRRGVITQQLLATTLLFFVFYNNGKYLTSYFIIYFLIFVFGSSFNEVLLYLFGFKDHFNTLSIFTGVPDIPDLLWFWDSFLKTGHEFSYGKTIYGGLIPYHYKWNPSVLTKLVIGASPDAPTGGFRLPFQVEGYYSFGIIGTIVWSMFNGFFNGILLSLARYCLKIYKRSFLQLFLGFFVLSIVGNSVFFIIRMSLDMAVSIFSSLIVFILIKYRFIFLKYKQYGV